MKLRRHNLDGSMTPELNMLKLLARKQEFPKVLSLVRMDSSSVESGPRGSRTPRSCPASLSALLSWPLARPPPPWRLLASAGATKPGEAQNLALGASEREVRTLPTRLRGLRGAVGDASASLASSRRRGTEVQGQSAIYPFVTASLWFRCTFMCVSIRFGKAPNAQRHHVRLTPPGRRRALLQKHAVPGRNGTVTLCNQCLQKNV